MSLTFTKETDMESDDECEYDSTWEDEIKTTRKKQSYRMSPRNLYAARDMQDFRHSCRNLDDVNSDEIYTMRNKQSVWGSQTYHHDYQDVFYNLEFYTGLRKTKPDNLHIDEFHKYWWRDYNRLEHFHTYIQWLFPIQEQGVNWEAHVLTKEEIRRFRENDKAKMNLIKSYKVMLDFYGIRLVNENTGELERSADWEERFDNLNRNTHNNLRITRILKCLGTLGLQHYQFPLVKFFLIETLRNKQLPKVKASVLDYFIFAVLDRRERKELVRFAYNLFQDKSKFVWAPRKILQLTAVNAHGENKSSSHAVNAHGENKASSAAVNAHGENKASSAAVNAHGENKASSAAVNAHGENKSSSHAVNAHGENKASSAAVNAHEENKTSSAAVNAHGENKTSSAALNAHEENKTSSAAVNAHEENKTSSAAVNAHEENKTSSAAVNAHGENKTSSAAVNAHEENKTSSAALNAHEENKTRFAPKIDSGKLHEESNKKQDQSATSYTAEDHKSDNTPENITGKQNGKRDSQVQAQQSTESVMLTEHSTDENNDSGQKVNKHSQLISNDAQGQEKNPDGGEATLLTMSQGADHESKSSDGPEEMEIC